MISRNPDSVLPSTEAREVTELLRRVREMADAGRRKSVLASAAETVLETFGYDRTEIALVGGPTCSRGTVAEHSLGGAPAQEVPIRVGGERVGVIRAVGPWTGVVPDERLVALGDLLGSVLAGVQLAEERRRELREVRDALARSEGEGLARDRYLTTLSHELRTPLTSIRSLSEVLVHSENDRATTREYLSLIHEETVRLCRMVNQLLDFDRLREGRIAWRFEASDAGEAAHAAARSAAAAAAGQDVSIEVMVAPSLPSVRMDRDRIVQVLVNLLTNAFRFSPAGSSVGLSVAPAPGGVLFEVTDQGPGIPPEERERVFERFHQLASARPRSDGVGLGLSISREIVRAHGGKIAVDEAPGGGARFRVRIRSRKKPAPAR
jgi:signal transduction histidine kinase